MKYQKREEDVKYDELKRLIESAYSCFDNPYDAQAGVNTGEDDVIAMQGMDAHEQSELGVDQNQASCENNGAAAAKHTSMDPH